MVLLPEVSSLSPAVLNSFSEKSRQCVDRLAHYNSPQWVDLSVHPTAKLAAVLVLLYERAGKLRVLLTTRSKFLRSHPGQTALPGGKADSTDQYITTTAYREAEEEVGLPIGSSSIQTITILRPFLSPNKLLVIPVVSLLTDLSILDSLTPSPGEVDHIFDHPVEAFLDPSLASDEPLVAKGSEHWPYDSEFHHPTDLQFAPPSANAYRMHRFRGTASPIKGLTADIMIFVSEIAYGTSPKYERKAPNQLVGMDFVLQALQQNEQSVISRQGKPIEVIE